MSPEQARGKLVDARSDIFSFGVVLYEMLVGYSPFFGETTSDIIASILTVEPPPPSNFNQNSPPELDRIVGKTLNKNLDERYQLAADLLQDLRRLQRRLQVAAEVEREVQATRTALKPESVKVPASTAIASLAVLPFINDSGNSKIEYLSDGLTENILFSLSQLPQVDVVARSAVFRHKGTADDPLLTGRNLGVSAIVTGRIRQRDQTLIITAELMNVETGRQLWGAQYKRSSDAVFEIEEEIASEISEKLKLKLSPDKQRVLDRRRTENPEAYHSYLKARFYWGKRTEESLTKSLQLFRQAIDADPMYALAHAGLAEGYVPFLFYGFEQPCKAAPRARAAAERAIEIDPELPEALTVLGSVLVNYEWDSRAGEQLMRKAIAIDPKYPRARQSLAECLTLTGRFSEANDEMKRALDLDPLSLHMNAAVVMHQYYARMHTEAIDYALQAIELDPGFYPTRYFLGLAYLARGECSEAIAQLQRACELSGRSTLMMGTLASALAAAEKDAEANLLLAELEQIEKSRYVSQTPIAAAYAFKGDIDEALSRLERASEDRCPWFLYAVAGDARFDRLREESRFRNLAKRLGREGSA
jgi:TolB-like protein/cytochrome c-type biogenesis protein CcmH/NrfG